MDQMNRKTDWLMTIIQVQEHAPDELLSLLANSTCDAVISSEMEIPEVADFLERSEKPLVVIGTRASCIPTRTRNVTFVSYDEDAIGRAGAKFLMSLGKFASYGFVHYTEAPYAHLSFLRERGFRRTLVAAGLDCTSFGEPGEEPAVDLCRMEDWLLALPKPAAVFVGCDKRAIEVLSVCHQLKLRVPGEISILSVDNDEILCNSTSPKLTSINTSIGKGGALAVDALIEMFRHPSDTPKFVRFSSTPDPVRRESCSRLPPGQDLARRAMAFISANASRSIGVQDVVASLHVSRRLADLRFRQYYRKSILEAITNARLAVVRAALLHTRETIDCIAAKCGFTNANYLKILFKRHMGMTMGEFRRTAASNARKRVSLTMP